MKKVIIVVIMIMIIGCGGGGDSSGVSDPDYEKEWDDCHYGIVEDYIPGNFTIELSNCGVLLQWDSDDYDDLWVRIKEEDKEYDTSEYVGSSNSYFVENLNYDQQYTFSVVQSNECNRLSSPIAELSATLTKSQIETVQDLSVKLHPKCSVRVAWKKNSDALSYRVFMRRDGEIYDFSSSASVSYGDFKMVYKLDYGKYFFAVLPVDMCGNLSTNIDNYEEVSCYIGD